MALIKCSECGHMISDKASRCPKCGCPTNKETVLRQEDVARSDMPVYYEEKGHTNKWLYAIIALLLAALAGGGYYFYDRNKQIEKEYQQKLITDSIARDSNSKDSIVKVETARQDSIEQVNEEKQKQLRLEECRKFVEKVYNNNESNLTNYCTINALNYLKKAYEEEYDACEDCYASWVFYGWGDSERVKWEFIAEDENTCRVIITNASGATYSVTMGLVKEKGQYKIDSFSKERYSSDWDG